MQYALDFQGSLQGPLSKYFSIAVFAVGIWIVSFQDGGSQTINSPNGSEQVYLSEQYPGPFESTRVSIAPSKSSADRVAPYSSLSYDIYSPLFTWPAGMTLEICFIDGKASEMTSVESFVLDNFGFVNLDFSFRYGDGTFRNCKDRGDGHVRIGFGCPASFSLVGTETLRTDLNAKISCAPSFQSMNLSRYRNSAPLVNELVRRDVLHEFGHALGLLHEHIRCVENYNKEELWGWLKQQKWSDKRIKNNYYLPDDHSSASVFSKEFDRLSIMMYTLPPFVFKNEIEDECFVYPLSTVLSERDMQALGRMYPKAGTNEKIAEVASTAAGVLDDLEGAISFQFDANINTEGHISGYARNKGTSNFTNIEEQREWLEAIIELHDAQR